MNALEQLLDDYWIIKEKDRETYYEVKRKIDNHKNFIVDKLGWRLIVNENLIKLEKEPAYGEEFMGISEFKDIKDYLLLCSILMFLEDKDEHTQFLLSELIHYVEAILSKYIDIDWTNFKQRKSLVRVLQYVEKLSILKVYEGDSENFAGNQENEVLYENTGVSKYFATNFIVDIKGFESIEDFEKKKLAELDDERGTLRSQRVFRQLLTTPSIYWKDNTDPDALYIKNQWKNIEYLLEKNLSAELLINKNSAGLYYVYNQGVGKLHPAGNVLSDVVLLVSREIKERSQDKRKLTIEDDDTIIVSENKLDSIILDVRNKHQNLWSKEFREMSKDKYLETVKDYLSKWMMIKKENEQYRIYPACVYADGYYKNDGEQNT